MNDPHVVALVYRVRHDDSVDYGRAEPLTVNEPRFRLTIRDQQVRFELKRHYATEQDARLVVDPLVRDWEFDVCLSLGPGQFELEFTTSEIIDRRPTEGVAQLSMSARAGRPTASVTLRARPGSYPAPPTGIDTSHPDVQTLFQRYKGFRQRNEPLPSFAYFCYTVLVQSTPARTLKSAGDRYRISRNVLTKIKRLASTKGGDHARKAEGTDSPLSALERKFLHRAVERLIRRVAEYHALRGNVGALPLITTGNIVANKDR